MAETPVVLVTRHLPKAKDVSIIFEVNYNLRRVLSILQNPGFQTEYLHQLKDWVHLLVIIFSYFTDIGGNVINITIVITSEKCIDGKYKKSLLLEKFKKLVS